MTELLGRAAERLAAVGDYAGAAKAEMLVGFRHWNEARTDEAIAARARAHELVDRAEPSPTVALVMSRLAINSMLQGEYQETLDLCERAGVVAERFGLEEIRGARAEHQGCDPREPRRSRRDRRRGGEHRASPSA